MTFQYLDWDSNFFGFKIGKIYSKSNGKDFSQQLVNLKTDGYHLIYLFVEKELDKLDPALMNFNGKLVDKKITYRKKINNQKLIWNAIITNYNSENIDGNLIELAIQSGGYSRFKSDKRFDPEKFEELYKLWMINSIRKEIAEEVFIYKENEILGFISVGAKDKIADIGLLAVHHSCRGKGIGYKLIQTAEDWAINQNYKEIQVITQGDNFKACKFYEKNGYQTEKQEYIYHFWL